ncbi:hypothetical protein BDB00DRAFT_856444 [Zychaea mexicana]|uniref:uncharacterized protein n=1 Tax=Zychaea mexicana TaxID=64656 RepID=UPI0022FE46CA|nr:uncharacterized protein BDB00DRAFT_856444 [Zychaea mexicana]KAI9484304.1 hypothetical protein BDB00DRAFT_856444 [Zychaea mexicana]
MDVCDARAQSQTSISAMIALLLFLNLHVDIILMIYQVLPTSVNDSSFGITFLKFYPHMYLASRRTAGNNIKPRKSETEPLLSMSVCRTHNPPPPERGKEGVVRWDVRFEFRAERRKRNLISKKSERYFSYSMYTATRLLLLHYCYHPGNKG